MKVAGLPLLLDILNRFPKVTIILDHFSQVKFEDGPPFAAAEEYLSLAKYKQVYLKASPNNFRPKSWGNTTPDVWFRHVLNKFGAERVAWGSNFPNSPGTLKEIFAACQKAFDFATSTEKDWVYGKTALELYPVLKD
jgi:predicted TIM-barrel fold metal-dependent hydrolase